MREYLAWFSKTTIKVVHPNQKMFMGAFQNRLRFRDFNESFTYRSPISMAEVMTHVEFYIKGKESNVEKRNEMLMSGHLVIFVLVSKCPIAIIPHLLGIRRP